MDAKIICQPTVDVQTGGPRTPVEVGHFGLFQSAFLVQICCVRPVDQTCTTREVRPVTKNYPTLCKKFELTGTQQKQALTDCFLTGNPSCPRYPQALSITTIYIYKRKKKSMKTTCPAASPLARAHVVDRSRSASWMKLQRIF